MGFYLRVTMTGHFLCLVSGLFPPGKNSQSDPMSRFGEIRLHHFFLVCWGHFGNNHQKREIFGNVLEQYLWQYHLLKSPNVTSRGLAKLPGIHAMFHHFSTVFVFDTCPGITRILDLSGLLGHSSLWDNL